MQLPDPNILRLPSDATWKTTTGTDPALPQGDSGWTYCEGVKWKAEEPSIIVGAQQDGLHSRGSTTRVGVRIYRNDNGPPDPSQANDGRLRRKLP